ncbi:MAG: DUF5668 domain-containing protein [Candidatus Eisenbacteria bacterium]
MNGDRDFGDRLKERIESRFGGADEARRGRLRFTGRLLFGIVLVTLGLLWTLENLGIAEADVVLRWWPALLVAYGFVRFTGLDGTKRVVSGVLFMLAGGWMLARELGYVHVSIFRLWPVFMIIVGASLVWRSVRGPRPEEDTDRESYPRPFAFMGGVSRTIESQDLAGMEVSAVMGGVELDLRGSKPRGREVVVETFAWWGGIEIVVPDDWHVVTEVSPIMGGVEDSTRRITDGDGPTLVVRGLVVMAGIEIRNAKRDKSDLRGVKVGVVTSGGSSSRKEVRGDPSGVVNLNEEVPPPPPAPGA